MPRAETFRELRTLAHAGASSASQQDPAMSDSYSFSVLGRPRPQGSMRAITVKGKTRLIPQIKSLPIWKTTVRKAASAVLKDNPSLNGPVAVELTFFLPRPAKGKFPVPAVAPDLDKLCRGIFDSIQTKGTSRGIVTDDARIVQLVASKHYTDLPPRVDITVSPVIEDEG